MNIPENAPNVPRVGLQFIINEDLEKVVWYGRGPHENYIDRKTSAPIEIYQSTVEEWITPYVMPQENGNRCDLRWMTLADESRYSLRITGANSSAFSASVWPYTQKSLDEALHNNEIERTSFKIMNIDCAQMGVGGDNSWGLPINDNYLLKPGNYQYSFIIKGEVEAK